METSNLVSSVLNKNEFLIKLNRLCLKVNMEFPARTPLDLSEINRLEPVEFLRLLDTLEQECTGLEEILAYILQLRNLIKSSPPNDGTSRHSTAAEGTPEDVLTTRTFYSHSEALKLAEQFDMQIVSERQGRDVYYKLIPKPSLEKKAYDQNKKKDEYKGKLTRNLPEFLEKLADVKKIEKQFGVKYEPVKQGRDLIGYKLVKKSS